jgi:PPM family protein phosphatase
MRFTIFQDSHIGGRKVNQDRLAYSYSKDVLLMVIADGMGGHARGELAAEIAVNTLTNRFQSEARTTIRRPKEFLDTAIQAAHRAIVAFADQNEMLECPRTTIVACVVQNGKAVWAHAGDSRLYVFRNGALATATEDHSRVQQMMNAGLITLEQAQVHPDRNKIYNCLGGVLPPTITHSDEWTLKIGDTIMLSTDGFWAPLNVNMIAAQLERQDILMLVPQLMAEAMQITGAESDNLSAISFTWERQDEDNPASTITMTSPSRGFTTQFNTTQLVSAAKDDISDADIEKAIAEIQNAIKKVSK